MPDNVLLILVDQLRLPRFAYGDEHGLLAAIKDILGFVDGLDERSPYAQYFPGFMALRRDAVALRNHVIASAACTPSRAAMMTGQYGTRTGVSQTDGLFKSGDAANFPWLAANGVPTLGDWFRAAGYSTHYFGKWHVSYPPHNSLEEWGFSDWELSYPEPHGQQLNNLGTYRDIGCSDLAATFLRRRGLGLWWDRAQGIQVYRDPTNRTPPDGTPQPFFAVVSLTNPHDIATYPALPRQLNPGGQEPLQPVLVPDGEARAPLPTGGSMSVPLNPAGFPQAGAHAPPPASLFEKLGTKPDCQFDASYKVGLALASAAGPLAQFVGVPFQLTGTPEEPDKPARWSEAFMQYYAYLMHVVDARIKEVLDALDQSGQRGSTIVVFTADHGEYGAAHGMMIEKWHGAYEEILRVPMVVSRPGWNFSPGGRDVRSVEVETCHIDLAPTLLGLAGFGADRWAELQGRMVGQWAVPFVGLDLSATIDAAAAGEEGPPLGREGVLFITDDMITEPLPFDGDPHSINSNQQFQRYLGLVEQTIAQVPRLRPGPVVEPCHVRCLRTNAFKLVRYFDPTGEVPDQWELYALEVDGLELYNLAVYDQPFPTLVGSDRYPPGARFDAQELMTIATRMLADLQSAEQTLLPPLTDPPGAPGVPSAPVARP